MSTNELTVESAINLIIRYAKLPIARKDLVDKCVKSQNLSAEQLKNKKPGALLNVIKCRVGEAIERLLRSKRLKELEDKKLQYLPTTKEEKEKPQSVAEEIARDIAIEKKIKEILKAEGLTKKQILGKVTESLKFPKVKEKDVKSDTGRVLSELVKNKIVEESKGVYSIPQKETTEERNARLFKNLSDEGLVEHTVAMLDCWYKKQGYTNVESQNIDGPQDGGIDGIIQAIDALGYQEKIILQVKHVNKENKSVPMCEIREFCGVLAAEDAMKGLFVTNAKYTVDTVKFVKKFKTKYIVLIDGEKWQALAKNCNYKL